MPRSFREFGLRVISGEDRSSIAGFTRFFASTAEPFYSAAMRIRNGCYERGWFATRDLGRPTISVGNITTGGTGKTPVVRWLAEMLRLRGRRPAILLRGYGSGQTGESDEGQLLDLALNSDRKAMTPVQACPSRVEGAGRVLREHPEVDVFLLDDAFQHRRAARDFDLVLISATNPFGFGHVLPRGLLREPLVGLGRADAFLVTRCSLVPIEAVAEIDRFLHSRHPEIPVYHCDHEHSGLLLPLGGEEVPMSAIAGGRVFLTAGIGDPVAFSRQIESAGCTVVGSKWFDDHYSYSKIDADLLIESATHAGADWLITTEKDWVKLKHHLGQPGSPQRIAVVKLSIQFRGDDEQLLLSQIEASEEKI
jgi:tetraacyldisaccharide 4'-kinase